MNNIYIQTLKLGFENPEGISFNEVVKRLNIDLSDESKKRNIITWFYTNFFNMEIENRFEGNLSVSFYWEKSFIDTILK